MDEGLAARAAARFGGIRADALERLADGSLAAQVAAGRYVVPGGFCLSAIARVATNADELLEPIRSLQMQLADASECYCYPPESLHISLLGLTQRTDEGDFDATRCQRASELTRAAAAGLAPCAMRVTGVNLLGNQWFLEVVPEDGRWAAARAALGTAAAAAGEAPMVHADAEPIHLNVARITGGLHAERAAALLRAPRFTAAWTVSVIELFLTDFVVDPAVAVAIDRIGVE